MEQQLNLRELLSWKPQLMRLRRKKLLYLALANPRRVYQRTILRKRSSMGERQHKIITRGKVARKFKGHTGIS